MYHSGQYTVATIATTLGVSRASIYRHLNSPGHWPTRPGSNLLLQDSSASSTACWRVLSLQLVSEWPVQPVRSCRAQ